MKVDYASLKEKLLDREKNGNSTGDFWMEKEFPHLYALFMDSGKNKAGKAGFGLSVTFQDHWWTVVLNWREAGQVAFINLSGLENMFAELERRLEQGKVEWRKSTW